MCGIIGYLAKDKKSPREWSREYVIDQYQAQHSRGKEGFGMTIMKDDGTVEVLRATEPVLMTVRLTLTEARHIILHHRRPTSTENTLQQTHPIVVSNKELKYDYLVNHNGVIRNTHELETIHKAAGYTYTTLAEYETNSTKWNKFNDSECLAIEMARYLENKVEEIGTTGAAAFIVVKINKHNKKVHSVIVGTNGSNPMAIAEFDHGFLAASENEYEGTELGPDHAVTYKALYGKKEELLGFKLLDNLPELKFKKEFTAAKPAAAPSAAAKEIDEDGDGYMNRALGQAYENLDKNAIGFGEQDKLTARRIQAHQDTYGLAHAVNVCYMPQFHEMTTKAHFNQHGKAHISSQCNEPWYHGIVTASAADRIIKKGKVEKNEGVQSFAHILQLLGETDLADVFKNKNFSESEAVRHFDRETFGKAYAAGALEECEILWNNYLESLDGIIDLNENLADRLNYSFMTEGTGAEEMPLALEDHVNAAKALLQKNMRQHSADVLAIYKLSAFVDTSLAIGYQYQMTLPGDKVIVNPTDEEIEESAEKAISMTSQEDIQKISMYEEALARDVRLKNGDFMNQEEWSEAQERGLFEDRWEGESNANYPKGWEQPKMRDERLGRGDYVSYAEYSESVNRGLWDDKKDHEKDMLEHNKMWGGMHHQSLCKTPYIDRYHLGEPSINENAAKTFEKVDDHIKGKCKEAESIAEKRFTTDMTVERKAAVHEEIWPKHHKAEYCGREEYHKPVEESTPWPDGKQIRYHDAYYDGIAKGVHTAATCGRHEFHAEFIESERTAEYAIRPRQKFHGETPKEEPNDAATLAVLEQAAGSMSPEDVLREVEIVADQVSKTAISEVEEQLQRVQALAIEEGKTISIGFHETKIKDIAIKTCQSFVKLAHLVQAARRKEDEDFTLGS